MNVSEAAAVEAGERLDARLSDPSQEYWYLCGPMSGYPQFNYPAFHEAATALRVQGYNILSPAELDPPEKQVEYESSQDGGGEGYIPEYTDLLGRDLAVVIDANCIGVICLPGWQASRGGNLETTVARNLEKPVMEYHRDQDGTGVTLVAVTFKDEPAPPVKRQTYAEDALDLVHGARQKDYGHPIEDFRRTAGIMTALLSKQLKPGERVREDQVPLLMIGVKLSRLVQSPYHEDSLRDLHGYGLTAEMVWDRQREEDAAADAQKAVTEAG